MFGEEISERRLVQCTRCRHKHWEHKRGKTDPDRYGMTTSICPRCRGQRFYRLGPDGKPERMSAPNAEAHAPAKAEHGAD